MSEPIDYEYFGWLCAKVLSPHTKVYTDLARILFQTEFVWVVPGDRNRAEDGLELKEYFLNETRWEKDPLWFNEPCSIFEFLIAFAQRASFQTDTSVSDWFQLFLTNLGLDEFQRVSNTNISIVEEILDAFVWRTYKPNGYGGLFPLNDPKEDQRSVEVWYQFCAWVDEKDLI